MQTTLISSHGAHCAQTKGAAVFKLPSNVIVFMNCDNAVTYSDEYYDSAFWSFATDSKLHLAMAKDKLDVNAFGKFLKSLEPLNDKLDTVENNFCVFADKCPDLVFNFEAKIFRSGLFTLPAKVVVRDDNTQDYTIITSAMFSKFASKDSSLSATEKRLIGAWTQYDNVGKLQKKERFVVKNRLTFPSENNVDNRLSNMINKLCAEQPDKMHFVIAWACRARQPVSLKLQQYSVTRNPYQTAIVVYDKVSKFLNNKK